MNVTRYGANKYHYTATVISERAADAEWNRASQSLVLRAYQVKDQHQEARHNYAISLSAKDIAAMLQKLADEALTPTAGELHRALADKTHVLAKLLLIAHGQLPGKDLTEASGDEG